MSLLSYTHIHHNINHGVAWKLKYAELFELISWNINHCMYFKVVCVDVRAFFIRIVAWYYNVWLTSTDTITDTTRISRVCHVLLFSEVMSKIYSGSATSKKNKKRRINGSWLCWFWDVKCCHGFSQLFLSFWSIFADILANWQQQKHAKLLHCCLHFMDVQTTIFGLLWNWRKL